VDELQKDIAVEKAAWLAEQQRKQHACSCVSLPGTPSPVSPAVSTPGSPMAEDAAQQQQQSAATAAAPAAAVAAAAAAVEWQEPRIGELLSAIGNA
jgi:hypothetical protein